MIQEATPRGSEPTRTSVRPRGRGHNCQAGLPTPAPLLTESVALFQPSQLPGSQVRNLTSSPVMRGEAWRTSPRPPKEVGAVSLLSLARLPSTGRPTEKAYRSSTAGFSRESQRGGSSLDGGEAQTKSGNALSDEAAKTDDGRHVNTQRHAYGSCLH